MTTPAPMVAASADMRIARGHRSIEPPPAFESDRGRCKVTPQIEEELLVAWESRRLLSEKSLCQKYGISRSTLRLAVLRARQRRARPFLQTR
jgi:hypothetical protein